MEAGHLRACGEREVLHAGSRFSRAVSEHQGESGRLLTFETRCGRFVLRELPSKDMAKRQKEDEEQPGSGWSVAADVPLYWSDGEPAGRMRVAFELDEAPSFVAKMGCFGLGHGFRVCAPRETLTQANEGSAPDDDSRTAAEDGAAVDGEVAGASRR